MLTKKTYNNRINVYSQNKIEPELIKIIINFLFYSKEDSEHNFELIKADKVGTEVWKLNYKNQFYFLKKYFPVKFVKKIKNIFRPTEAVRHFITTILLNRSGIDSFEPVAALTYRKSLWSFDSIFVMKEYKGLLLKDFIKSDLGNLKNDEIIAKKFALLWKNLLKNNFWHQDPSPVNFIVNTKTLKPEVNLIDVDNIYKVPYLPIKYKAKSLAIFEHKILLSLDQEKINHFSFEHFLEELLKVSDNTALVKKFISKTNQELLARIYKKNDQIFIKENPYLEKINYKYQGGNIN